MINKYLNKKCKLQKRNINRIELIRLEIFSNNKQHQLVSQIKQCGTIILMIKKYGKK